MQLVWRPTFPTIHEIKHFHLFDLPKKPLSVFWKGLYTEDFVGYA